MTKSNNFFILIFLVTLLLAPLTLAEYSIDISGLKNEEYGLGEELNFEVILLDGDNLIDEIVKVTATDVLNKKEISKTVSSNSNSLITIGKDFPSGIWTLYAEYNEETFVERNFVVGASLEVEFEIINDELHIKNMGNIRYTKTIQITIGSSKNSYVQNIGVGEEKVLKLISAKGTYDIVVTDGTTTLRRQNVQLSGTTGNVVGAVDEELVGYTGFAGTEDPTQEEGQFSSLSKLPLALTFIAGVLILGALVFVERKLSKR